jgi:hypothetical protein
MNWDIGYRDSKMNLEEVDNLIVMELGGKIINSGFMFDDKVRDIEIEGGDKVDDVVVNRLIGELEDMGVEIVYGLEKKGK